MSTVYSTIFQIPYHTHDSVQYCTVNDKHHLLTPVRAIFHVLTTILRHLHAGCTFDRSTTSARQAMTLEAIHAQQASVLYPAAAQEDEGNESADNAELEKVAAFICSYAGEELLVA